MQLEALLETFGVTDKYGKAEEWKIHPVRTSRRGNLIVIANCFHDFGYDTTGGYGGSSLSNSVWAVVNPTTREVLDYSFEQEDYYY